MSSGIQSNNNITFELHSLGWKAFQDLCATILGTILGQNFEVFSHVNDGGRDGAFKGVWNQQKGELITGSFTVQCKFTKNRDKNLTISLLDDDIFKAQKLAAQGLADNYILMTNHQTGNTKNRRNQRGSDIR